jgi:hypothetical protein
MPGAVAVRYRVNEIRHAGGTRQIPGYCRGQFSLTVVVGR